MPRISRTKVCTWLMMSTPASLTAARRPAPESGAGRRHAVVRVSRSWGRAVRTGWSAAGLRGAGLGRPGSRGRGLARRGAGRLGGRARGGGPLAGRRGGALGGGTVGDLGAAGAAGGSLARSGPGGLGGGCRVGSTPLGGRRGGLGAADRGGRVALEVLGRLLATDPADDLAAAGQQLGVDGVRAVGDLDGRSDRCGLRLGRERDGLGL